MEQPPGYEILGHENNVYKIKKELYALKQAPRSSYIIIDSYLLQMISIGATMSLNYIPT